MKTIIIGGVAAGPKVAARIVRLMPDAEVTIVERGKLLSYAGCGLPYYVSGVVEKQAELMCTPVGVVRDPVFFQKVKNVHVRNQTEAIRVDRSGKRVQVKDVNTGEQCWLDYDKLVFATGARPVVPPIPNIDLQNIFISQTVNGKVLLSVGYAERQAVFLVGVGCSEIHFLPSADTGKRRVFSAKNGFLNTRPLSRLQFEFIWNRMG